ncbi:MAG TPA: class I SAM-dependent methyltransferase [Isosphaeraceae bacterium]|nr:class I SAM-dependent methyltransferase [Isosphaeraceae bacterium]
MSLYSRLIFPRLCDWAMRTPHIERLRREVLAKANGEILEIGFGTGLNLGHYPEHVRHLTAVDPGVGMTRIARRRIKMSHINVDLRVQSGEELPFEDGRFDCVVSTWTLCSIREAGRAVSEIGRVLRPEGRYVFLEHGLGDDPGVQRWQRRLSPLQRRVADGCRLDVDVEALIRTGPFGDIRVERFLLENTPRVVGSMYRGVAVK